MNDHQLRREHLLDRAQADGRIIQASRATWATAYDADPAATERYLAMLIPIPVGVLGPSVDQTAAAGRLLMQAGPAATAFASEPTGVGHARPVVAASEVNLSPELVEGWTRELFRETRAGAGARNGRITRDAAA